MTSPIPPRTTMKGPRVELRSVMRGDMTTAATTIPAPARKSSTPRIGSPRCGRGETTSPRNAATTSSFVRPRAGMRAEMTDATTAKDVAALQAGLAAGQSSATTPDDKYLVGFFQLQLGLLNKDQALQGQVVRHQHAAAPGVGTDGGRVACAEVLAVHAHLFAAVDNAFL